MTLQKTASTDTLKALKNRYKQSQAELIASMIDTWKLGKDCIHIDMKDGSTLSIDKATAMAFKKAKPSTNHQQSNMPFNIQKINDREMV